jgi:queuine tRNA-ribosyltransferase catalytic subunit
MVSLSKLCEVTENGVNFESPYDKTMMHLRPEDSIKM